MKIFVHPQPGLAAAIAGDESFTWVDAATLVAHEVTDLFVYCGAAMPPPSYLQAVLGAGISVTFIDEGAVDPYAVGDPFGAGVARVRAAEAKLVGIYPAGCPIVYVLSDQNVSTPGPGDPRVAAHAQGIDTATTRPGWVGYTNRNGIDTARPVAPRMRASWVPITWGANSSDALVQLIGSPIDGLDVDTIQIAEWGQWRLNAAPTPTAQEVDVIPLIQYAGHPEPRQIFRITEVNGVLYRIPCQPHEVEALTLAGAIKFSGPYPQIPVLNAPQFSVFSDPPAGGFPTGAGASNVPTHFTGTLDMKAV